MMYLISANEFNPINGSIYDKKWVTENVTTVDETISRLLSFPVMPTRDDADVRAFNISRHVIDKMNARNKEYETYLLELAKWNKEFGDLPLEEKEAIIKADINDPRIKAPTEVFNYDGVMIGEDVPHFLMPFLATYFKRYNIGMYYLYNLPVYGEVETVPTDTIGLSEIKTAPTGETKPIVVSI